MTTSRLYYFTARAAAAGGEISPDRGGDGVKSRRHQERMGTALERRGGWASSAKSDGGIKGR